MFKDVWIDFAKPMPFLENIVTLPHTLEELPTLSAFAVEKPSPSKISLDVLGHMIAIYPLRRGKGSAPTTSPQAAMSSQPSGIDVAMANLLGAVGMQHMSSSMDWLRALQVQSQGTASVQLPGLQMLTPPPRTACPHGDRQVLAIQDGPASTTLAAPEVAKQQAMKLDSGFGQSQVQVENEGALVVANQAQDKADCAKAPTQAQVKDETDKQGSQPAVG